MGNQKRFKILSFSIALLVMFGAFAVGMSAEDSVCEKHNFDYNSDFTAEITESGVCYKCVKCGEVARTAEFDGASILLGEETLTINSKSVDLIENTDFYNDILNNKYGGNIWITFGVTPTDLSDFSRADGGHTLLKLQIGNTHRIFMRGYRVDDETVRFTAQNSAGKTVELSGEPMLKKGNNYQFVIEVDPETGKYYIYLDGQYLGGSGFKLDYGSSEEYKLFFGGSGNFQLTNFKIFNPTKMSEQGTVMDEAAETLKEYTVICQKCGSLVCTMSGMERHNEAVSGIAYTDGAFKVNHNDRPNYLLPNELVGADKGTYKIEFKLTLDKSASIGALEGIYNGGNGRNLLRYDGTFNSILRQYPVSDGNGGYVPETVELKSKGDGKNAISLVTMKVGDSVNFTFYVSPAENTVDIYVNDAYAGTKKGDNPAPADAVKICFGDTASPMHFTVSDISIVSAADNAEESIKVGDGVERVDGENCIFKCSCGEFIGVYGSAASVNKVENYMSQNGIDRIIGLRSLNIKNIVASEDTYVSAGSNKNNNYCDENRILIKNSGGESLSNYDRMGLIKFDISSLGEFTVERAWLELICMSLQDPTLPVTIHVYGCNPYDWKETDVTFSNIPEKEELITTVTVTASGSVKMDITDYVKLCRRFGDKEISFYIEGESETPYSVEFYSTTDSTRAPKLIVTDDVYDFATKLEYNDEDPWELAMRNVSTWINRWEQIKSRGDSDTFYVDKDESEYSVMVGVSGSFNGASTKFTDIPMRNVSTLKGYTASVAENDILDVYGGLMDESMRQEATGYFHTKKIGDRWWTFDPLGYPFFRAAATSVKIGNNAERRAAALAKYGSPLGWTEAITDKLKSLGFNSVGGFSGFDENLHTQLEAPLSQTHIMYVMKRYAGQTKVDVTTGGNTALYNDVMPVFDPAFVSSADESVRIAVSEHATNPFVYGWMSDNELPRPINMLDNYLTLDHSDERFVHSYATAWTFMFMRTGKIDVSFDDVTDELRKEFRAMVYDKYFEVTCAALERYAPYQQYMGCRFYAGSLGDEYIMRVAGHWCDVITYNYYIKGTPDFELLGNQIKWAGKPVVITEWYVKGLDVWEKDSSTNMVAGAGAIVRTQEDRGKYYQNFALALIESKNCVGYDWFWLQDYAPSDGNKGLFDAYGNEYTDMTKYAKELNTQKYNLIEFFDGRNN